MSTLQHSSHSPQTAPQQQLLSDNITSTSGATGGGAASGISNISQTHRTHPSLFNPPSRNSSQFSLAIPGHGNSPLHSAASNKVAASSTPASTPFQKSSHVVSASQTHISSSRQASV